MSHPANDLMYDDLRERREQFLEEHGASETDVEKDDDGKEYIEVMCRTCDKHTTGRIYLPSVEEYDDQPPAED